MTYVLFDVDGVLINGYHAKPELRHCWDEHIERDFGISRKDFFDHYISGVFVEEVLVGKANMLDTLSAVLPRIGYTGNPQDFIDYWLKNDARLNQDLLAQVKALSALDGVDLYIATNQAHERADFLMQDLGLGQYFKAIFHSAAIGHRKPSDGYFKGVDQQLGRDPARKVIFFDDTQAIIDAANAHGWEAHQFDGVKDLKKSTSIQSWLGL